MAPLLCHLLLSAVLQCCSQAVPAIAASESMLLHQLVMDDCEILALQECGKVALVSRKGVPPCIRATMRQARQHNAMPDTWSELIAVVGHTGASGTVSRTHGCWLHIHARTPACAPALQCRAISHSPGLSHTAAMQSSRPAHRQSLPPANTRTPIQECRSYVSSIKVPAFGCSSGVTASCR